MQLEAVKPLGAAEGGAGLSDRRLKVLFGAGLDVDLCNFGDHRGPPFAGEWTSLAQPAAKKKGADRRPAYQFCGLIQLKSSTVPAIIRAQPANIASGQRLRGAP